MYTTFWTRWVSLKIFWRAPLTQTYRQLKVHYCFYLNCDSTRILQDVSHMYINTSFKYHRVTCTQSCVITKAHDLLGQPSYTMLFIIKKWISFFVCSSKNEHHRFSSKVNQWYSYFHEPSKYISHTYTVHEKKRHLSSLIYSLKPSISRLVTNIQVNVYIENTLSRLSFQNWRMLKIK